MEKLAPYWKAVMAFLAPAALIVVSSLLPDSDGGTVVTASEWMTAAATAVLTSAGVYTIRNRPLPEKNPPADPLT